MKPQVKVILYALLIAGAVFFGYKVYRIYEGRAAPPRSSPASGTNHLAATATNATAPVINLPPNEPKEAPSDTIEQFRPSGQWLANVAIYGSILFGFLVGLGILIGRDVSHFTANKVEEFLFNDEGEGIVDPEYEQAEELWKKGQHLEAVQLMRDHYRKTHGRSLWRCASRKFTRKTSTTRWPQRSNTRRCSRRSFRRTAGAGLQSTSRTSIPASSRNSR
jgi:hypothetical protein